MMQAQLQDDATPELQRAPDAVDSSVMTTMEDLVLSLMAYVQREKLSGQVLHVQSGDLINSLDSKAEQLGNAVVGTVFTQGVPYAAIHEYGGTINHPGSDKYQVFTTAAGLIRTHFTRPHQINIPERSYMRTSLAENIDGIRRALIDATLKGFSK